MGDVDELTLIERHAGRRRELAVSFPNLVAVTSLDEVPSELDGVVVATRSRSHVELGLRALRAGANVLIEKPMAMSLAEATTLCDEADQRDLVLMVGHTFEFNPAVVELRRRIVAGELGDIHYIRSLRLNLGLYQGDVNVIWDLAPHDVSIVNYLLDDMPSNVTAWGHRSASDAFEDVGMLRLEYLNSNVVAYIHVSWLDPSKVREVTVVGSKKMAVYDDLKTDEPLRIYDRGVTPQLTNLHEAPMSYRYGDVTSPFINFKEPLALEDGHFVEAIRRGQATRATGASGRLVVAVLEAAERSLVDGLPVDLADLLAANPARVDESVEPSDSAEPVLPTTNGVGAVS